MFAALYWQRLAPQHRARPGSTVYPARNGLQLTCTCRHAPKCGRLAEHQGLIGNGSLGPRGFRKQIRHHDLLK